MDEVLTDDREFLLSIAYGDEQAFASLFYSYLPCLHPFVMKFTKSAYDTEEVIQNTFLRLWLNREKFSTVVNIRSWLFKYASYECLNYLRSKKYKNKFEEDLIAADFNNQFNLSTTEAVNVSEIKQLIYQAVQKLPKQRREVYNLSRNYGLTIPEISAKLQISPNTAKNTLVSSLKFLREYLSSHGYTLSLLFFIFF